MKSTPDDFEGFKDRALYAIEKQKYKIREYQITLLTMQGWIKEDKNILDIEKSLSAIWSQLKEERLVINLAMGIDELLTELDAHFQKRIGTDPK